MRDNEIVGLWEAYLQVHQPKEEVEQLDEEMTTSHPFRTGTLKPPAAPTLPPPASGKPTKPKQKPKIKPVGEEVENWVNSLIDEGYDLSEYTWEDMYEMYVNLDEAKSRLPTRGIDPEVYSQFYGNASRSKKVKGKKTPQPGQNRYLAKQNQKRSAKRYAADMGRDRTPSASDYDNHGGGSRNEQADLFDAILEYLVAEGYADTNESALVIMANMSEEWRESIVEGVFDILPRTKTNIPQPGVLARKGGVEGSLNKATNKFTPHKGGWDRTDAQRYSDETIKRGGSSGVVNLANRRVTPNRVN